MYTPWSRYPTISSAVYRRLCHACENFRSKLIMAVKQSYTWSSTVLDEAFINNRPTSFWLFIITTIFRWILILLATETVVPLNSVFPVISLSLSACLSMVRTKRTRQVVWDITMNAENCSGDCVANSRSKPKQIISLSSRRHLGAWNTSRDSVQWWADRSFRPSEHGGRQP